MTNEKAISIVKNAFSWYEDNARESEEEDWSGQHEALRMAIQALEAQPTDADCISREEALLALTGMDLPTDRDKLIALFTERIQQMPSVTPERPKGKWIYGEDNLGGTGRDGWYCNQCGHFGFWDYSSDMKSARRNLPNFCPNCGAEMGGAND